MCRPKGGFQLEDDGCERVYPFTITTGTNPDGMFRIASGETLVPDTMSDLRTLGTEVHNMAAMFGYGGGPTHCDFPQYEILITPCTCTVFYLFFQTGIDRVNNEPLPLPSE
jgi:hypothetical protein